MTTKIKTRCIICGLNIRGWKEVGDDRIRYPRREEVIGKEFVCNNKHGYAHISCIKKSVVTTDSLAAWR